MPRTSIKDWAEDDQPREKMLLKGTGSLSNAELLAILISSGTKEKSAVDVAKDLLSSSGNELRNIARLNVNELVKLKIKGIGKARAITIAAALELGIRREAAEKRKESVFHSRDIAEFLRAKLKYTKHEVFMVVFLNRANKIMHHEVVSEGGITGTVADPRIILKKALLHDAVNIILCHNHPSGSTKPSWQDEALTKKIKEAAKYLDIKVIDHIIVSDEGYYSFADGGLL